MNTLEAIYTRRSTRKYLDKPIEEEKLGKVIEAGRHSPSGGNSQSCHFLVIENKQILEELAHLVQQEFSKMEVYDGMYKSLVSSILQSKQGRYDFYYHAPVLIVVANKKDYGNALADSACALENMMLAANELDLGSCWINQLKWLNENEILVNYLNKLGLNDDEKVYGSLSLGYPQDGLPLRTPLKRVGNKVTYIK